MADELALDDSAGITYASTQLNAGGTYAWPRLLAEALESHDPEWLGDEMEAGNYFNATATRMTKNGPITVAVPSDAAHKLANGEFNRYYVRAVCLLAIERGQPDVTVIRAKISLNPRPESQMAIGNRLSAAALLADMRDTRDYDTLLGINKPNSGLSVSLD